MCGRFSLHLPAQTIAEYFLALNLTDVQPRYNIAPTSETLCIFRDETQPTQNQAGSFYWGLVPAWAKSMDIGAKLTNARSETLGEKPSFRAAYIYRRCLIPVSGFYEWKRSGSHKQPYYFRPPEDKVPFAFAGLWEVWTDEFGRTLWSCTIITCEANAVMRPIHHRMPVILGKEAFDLWLDPTNRDKDLLRSMMQPCPNDWITHYPVSTYVNKAGNEGDRCIAPLSGPLDAPPEQMSLF